MQFPRAGEEGGVEVETVLCHSSGEWVAETLWLPVAKSDAQGVGSAITYARRYALCCVVGIAPEDDDGNAAAASAQALRQKALAILQPASLRGVKALEQAWNSVSAEMRRSCKNDLPGLKQEAAKADKANHKEEPHAATSR